mgnify:CR=1 FL=1
MNKAELIDAIAASAEVTKADAARALGVSRTGRSLRLVR